MDICHDVKTFLERMCRTCSRFYGESEDITFHDLFQLKFRSKKTARKANAQEDYDDEEEEEDIEDEDAYDEDVDDESISIVYELNDDIKSIFEDFEIWKLNIKPNDGLPQQICANCRDRFCQVRVFREECLDSQKLLYSYFRDIDQLLQSNLSSPRSENGRTGDNHSRSSDSDQQQLRLQANQKMILHQIQKSNGGASSSSSSPKLRLSPRFGEITAYADSTSSMGTPPPIFEEIKTEPIDMETMESIKPESELPKSEEPVAVVDDEADAKSGDWHSIGEECDSAGESSCHEEEEEEADEDEEVEEGEESESENQKKGPGNRLYCRICGVRCRNRVSLRTHRNLYHPQEKPYVCNICSSSFKSGFQLTQHKLKHNRPDTMQCKQCDKYFRSQLHLQRHIKNFHLTSTYTCHICNQQLENFTQMRYQYHIRQHGEKRFPCSYCPKAFHQKIHLTNHERIHTREQQQFQCGYCGKTYRHKPAYLEHMKTHHKPKAHKCIHCSKSFIQRGTFRIHLQKVHGLDKTQADNIWSKVTKSFHKNS